MIGVAQQVVLAARAPVLRIEFETRDDVVDDRARDRDFGEQKTERVERHVAGRLARERLAGLRADMCACGRRIMPRFHFAALYLSVGQIFGDADTGVAPPAAFASFRAAPDEP